MFRGRQKLSFHSLKEREFTCRPGLGPSACTCENNNDLTNVEVTGSSFHVPRFERPAGTFVLSKSPTLDILILGAVWLHFAFGKQPALTCVHVNY